MSEWFKRFATYFTFPDDYIVIDTETSGVQPEECHLCVIGHTFVQNRVPVETKETYLNWWLDPDTDHAELEDQLRLTQKIMEEKKKTFAHTKERLQAIGRPPKEVLAEYLALFEEMEPRKQLLVGHNLINFDAEFFQAAFHNTLKVPFIFNPSLLMDTGLLLKASQMPDNFPYPTPEETVYKFLRRVGRTPRKGVFWALDRYCEDKYGLSKKANVDKSQAHTAGTDSLLTAFLVEEIRQLANG